MNGSKISAYVPVMFKPNANSLKTKAFTIIELLIVITMLGILIGISVPKIKAMQQNGKTVKAQREVATIMTALESYYTFGAHSYPVETTPMTHLQLIYLLNATPNMMSSVIYDPFAAANTEYSYVSSSNGQYYVVWSVSLAGPNPPIGIDNSGRISY